MQDVRYAFRSLGRAPGFTLVALVTLALGIGSTTAIFSVVDAILLRPLPYPEAAAIVSVSRSSPNAQGGGAFSPADYLDYRNSQRSFAALAAYRQVDVDLSGSGEPIRLHAFETTGGFFDVFGLRPLLGRVYTESGDAPQGPRLAVISEGLWRQQFGSEATVIGRVVRLNGIPTTLIGVMPASLTDPASADLWILAPNDVPTSPLAIDGDLIAEREVQYFQAVARLRPGVTVAQAREDLQAIGLRLAREHPDTNEGESATIVPYLETMVGDVRTALLVLLGAVAFVLLIACANVASLLLARGAARRRELAVRAALGAGRPRLIRQLLTESLVLATAGGVLGLVVAYWGIAVLQRLAPESIPRLEGARLDLRITVFSIAVSAVVGVLFGIVPAFQASRVGVTDALKDGGRTGSRRTRAQNVLVVVEVALALVLLIGAGLMLTSFARLRAVDLGFSAASLVIVGVPLPQARYDNQAQARFYTQLFERLRESPITARSALGFPTPFSGFGAGGGYSIEGAPPQSRAERSVAQLTAVTPGYFATLGIPILRGRDVELSDTRDRPGVVLINQTLANREWPGQNPLGKRIALGGNPSDPASWLTVIGIVADSRRSDLQDAQPPAIYISHGQFTLPFMGVVVRTTANEETIANAVRAAVRALDAELPVDEVQTVESRLERATGQPRFRAFLIAVFAGAALLLAAVGLYGLISYTVTQRVPEIGVRLALGATPMNIRRLVLGQGLTLAAAGVALGLIGALAVTRLLEGLLFSISAADPAVYSTLAAVLLTIAAVACYVPARRAMRVDPMTALRAE